MGNIEYLKMELVVNVVYHLFAWNADIKLEHMMLNVLNARMIIISLMEYVMNVLIKLLTFQVENAIIIIVLVVIIIKIIFVIVIIIM